MKNQIEYLNYWMASPWSSANVNNNTSRQFTQCEPSDPGEASMIYLSFLNPPFGYLANSYINVNSSVTHEEGKSLSTDLSDSTFLKLDVEDFIQSCIGQSSSHCQHPFSQSLPNYLTCPFKQYAQMIPSQTATIPQEKETNPKSSTIRSLPPKISKNTSSRRIQSSSSSSFDKRKRNKRNCLPGEMKMINWKWNKATIKECL